MRIFLFSLVSAICISFGAHAQRYEEGWRYHNHHNHERYYETVCRPEFRGYDFYGRPVYRERCWQEERWR